MMSAANIAIGADVVTARRLRLQPNGYPPVPVAGPQMSCRSPGKQPLMKDWHRICASADAAEIGSWAKTEPGCTNTGILCGAVAGVDIDVPVADLAAQVEAAALVMLGETPLRRVGRAPKGSVSTHAKPNDMKCRTISGYAASRMASAAVARRR